MRNIVALLLILALCGCGAAVAEVEGPLFEAKSIYGLDAAETGCLEFTNYKDGYGILSVEGQVLCAERFGNVSHAGEGYFEVINENGLDTHGLVDSTGAELIPYSYSAFQVYSKEWIGAVSLTPTDDENGDYSSGFFGAGDQYNIDHVDLWYMPESRLAGTLSREQFKEARSVGGGAYLLVRDRSGGLTMYDAAFESAEHLFEDIDDAEIFIYQPNKLQAAKLYSRVSCQAVSEDVPDSVETISYTKAYCGIRKEIQTESGTDRRSALMTSDGRQLTDYVLGSVTRVCEDRYVISNIYNRDSGKTLYGVYDLEADREILPFAYEQIRVNGERIGQNGYFMVIVDDKMGFVDAEGNVTCPIDYLKANVDHEYGCCFTYRDGSTLLLVAADGTVTDLTEKGVKESMYTQEDNDGRFIPVKNADGQYAVFDWHGNAMTDFVLTVTPEIHRDGYMVYVGGIYHLSL